MLFVENFLKNAHLQFHRIYKEKNTLDNQRVKPLKKHKIRLKRFVFFSVNTN